MATSSLEGGGGGEEENEMEGIRTLEKGLQGTCIKDPWTKPKGRRIKGGRWGWVGRGRVLGGCGNGDNCT